MENNTATQATTSTPAPAGDSASAAPVTTSPSTETPAAASTPVESSSQESSSSAPAETPKEAEAKVETKTDAPTPAENVLGDTKPEPEVKKTDEAAKPEEGKQSGKEAKTEVKEKSEAKPTEGEKPTAPTYEFKLPENIQVEKEPLENFQKLLGEIETGKLDHETLQAKGQALVDMHIKGVQESLQRQTDYYVNVHKQQGDEWLQAFKKDPDLGGSNLQETVADLQGAVGRFAGNETQLKEFRDVMKNTNVGNHPAVIRFIKNMSDTIKKYESEPQNGMVPAAKPAPIKVKPHELFYSRVS